MSMFLNIEDLEELSGYKNKSKQRQWLISHRIPFMVNRWGQPLVLKKIIEKELGDVPENNIIRKDINEKALLKMMGS